MNVRVAKLGEDVCLCVKLREVLLFAWGYKHILQACFQILNLVLKLLVN